MPIKHAIPALAVCASLCAGAAFAQQTNTTATFGGGAAVAGDRGPAAGGVTAGSAPSLNSRQEERRGVGQRRHTRSGASAPANATSTYGSGAVYTDRNSTSAGVTSGASAAGSGEQSAGTSIGAYGETTRDGTSADVYGDSAATSGTQR